MIRLDDIVAGCRLKGLIAQQAVTVVAVSWYGNTVLDVTYKDEQGQLGSELLYREDESRLEISGDSLPFSFDADADLMRLASEAYRINLAHLFDPYLAIYTSEIDPLPHQISAVYQEMLPRLPLRYILADDPGAGKTIMTGLLIKESMIRGDLNRCLIVTPGSLAEQWQEELFRKFNLRFEIFTNDRYESAIGGNVFKEVDRCIARLDKLSRNDDIQDKLKSTEWDLIVVDEAHKMSATVWGNEVKYTKRYQLGQLLSRITKNYLLLTATPHNGKEKDFQLFMALIDPDRFEGARRGATRAVDVSDVMRRLVKEELLKFDGRPLFPERIATTVNYDLSPLEAMLYEAVTEYVREEFNRADNLTGERKTTVGFALTVLQRRLASSPEAIYKSLKRRRERLEHRLNEERLGKRAEIYRLTIDEDYDEDDLPSREMEAQEEAIVDQSTAATTIFELEAEISTIKRLEELANKVRYSGEDRKWEELSKLLQDDENMFGSEGQREKLIIFTEHRDTLRYLTDKIRSLLGREEVVVTIHGGMLRDERRKVEAQFKQDKEVRILVATDAAGEGINLQRAHLMVNYDLPWNPNRLEQRFGRIHRIGQTEVCHLWNLVAKETREGMVFQRLFEKLETERDALKGKVFDVLGKVSFDNRPLKDLLLEAVRYGNSPDVKARLNRIVDNALDRENLLKLLDEYALVDNFMDANLVKRIKEEMERIEAHRLQPHFVESFFLEAFRNVGGRIRRREKGRYEVTFVPQAVRLRDLQIGFGEPLLPRYERICFDKEYVAGDGQKLASLVAPGSPLLNATIDLVLERHMETLKRGTIFIDDSDAGNTIRLLFYIEDKVQDGVVLPNGSKRIISKRLHFVEMMEDGSARNAGHAPYLDYRSPTEEEKERAKQILADSRWLTQDVQSIAMNYAITELVPSHVSKVRKERLERLDKMQKAVEGRLTEEINYWDFRAWELSEKESAGQINKYLHSEKAKRKAEELASRLKKRKAELESEKHISALPPNIVGSALVIPKSLLTDDENTDPGLFAVDTEARRRIEMIAMQTVMDIERSLGHEPRDVSRDNTGFDIESRMPHALNEDEPMLRLIEVKGRAAGATSITVTKNEILKSFNAPESYILAIVEIEDRGTKTTYLKQPFSERPDFAATSVNYNINGLKNNAKIVLEREQYEL